MIKISNRLKWLSLNVTYDSLADIGTDHGFVPIYLMDKKLISKAIAMDVNKGPLERAKEHILEHSYQGEIEARLSDGMRKLCPGEVDSALIAGMGGDLICKILAQDIDTARSMKEIILSPHSQWDSVRRFLEKNAFEIDKEEMLYDEEKYYLMIKCHYNPAYKNDKPLINKEISYRYGDYLIKDKSKAFRDFLEFKIIHQTELIDQVSLKSDKAVEKLMIELEELKLVKNYVNQ